MPKEKRPLDVEAILMWLIERVEAHIGGGDVSARGLISVAIPSVAGSGAVDSTGAPASGSKSQSVVLPTLAGSGAVDSTGAAASGSTSQAVVLPTWSGSGAVIPP